MNCFYLVRVFTIVHLSIMNYVLRFDGCYFTNPDIAHKNMTLQVLLSRGLSTSVGN